MNRASKTILAGLFAVATLGFLSTAPAKEPAPAPTVATATLHGHEKNEKITGTVVFTAETGGVKVVADVEGLTPGSHGFHIHQLADLSKPDFSGAGPHWNPGGHKHGAPDAAEHHAGDLGNLVADDKGHAHLELVLTGVTIEGKEGVVGHSVIVHAKPDDLHSQPAGDSGARIAGGVIKAETEAADSTPKP